MFIKEKSSSAKMMNGLSLAYIGDSVYELMVREYLLRNGPEPVGKLHKKAVEFVKAPSQAKIFDALLNIVSEDEKDIMMRGRNCSSTHVPRGALAIEYRKATGLESLFGWLYLNGSYERIDEIFNYITNEIFN